MAINQALRDRAIAKDSEIRDALNREVVPVVRATRAAVNAMLATPSIVASSELTLTLDWTQNYKFSLELSESITAIAFKDSPDRTEFFLLIEQTAAYTVTGWPSNVTWLGGATGPTITTTPGAFNLLTFFFDGTTYYGSSALVTGDGGIPAAHASTHLPGGSDALATAAAGSIQPDDSAAEGTAASFARSDHQHAITAATAGAITPGDSAAEGAATSFARSDHKHSIAAFGSTGSTFCVGNDSRLSDARTPTAHHTSHESGGGDAIKLDDLSAPDNNTDLNASTSAHGLAPKGTAGSTLFWRQDWTLASPVSAATIPSERWALPTTAHASDEEFNTSSLSNFTLYDSSGNAVASEPTDTTIDPYSNDTTHHHADANVYKPSWLTFKCRNNNARFYYVKSFSPATNVCCYSRCNMKARPSPANQEDDIALMYMAQTSSHPDPNNRVELIMQQTTSGRRFIFRITSAGVDNTVFTGSSFGTEWELYSYLTLHKLGTTIHAWLSGDSGGRAYLGSGTFSGTILYCGYMFQTNSSTPGNGINQSDFLRFVDSATFLP